MAEKGGSIRTRAATTGPINWFANVIRVDAEPTETEPIETTALPTDTPVDSEGRPTDRIESPSGASTQGRWLDRYQRLPGWVFIVQVFLAFGWIGTGLNHVIQTGWWSGRGVTGFVATHAGTAVDVYRPILTGVIESNPIAVAIAVVAIELSVAVMLLLNRRTLIALGLASFLNLQLILAGAVSPSLFFLIGAIIIAVWRLEATLRSNAVETVAALSLPISVMAVAFLIPSVRSANPGRAFSDPALALIVVAVLTAGSIWWVHYRVRQADRALARLTGDPGPEAVSALSMMSVGASAAAATAILVAGLLAGGTGADEEDPATADVPASSIGTADEPYPFGRDVTLTYDAAAADDSERAATERRWRVQVLESRLDEGTAQARIRLTYSADLGAGPVDDISFLAVGRSGEVLLPDPRLCDEPRIEGGELVTGQAVEGWVCWPGVVDELDSLVMAVEAEPADGVLYMDLHSRIEE